MLLHVQTCTVMHAFSLCSIRLCLYSSCPSWCSFRYRFKMQKFWYFWKPLIHKKSSNQNAIPHKTSGAPVLRKKINLSSEVSLWKLLLIFLWGRRGFFRRLLRVWIGFYFKIGFSVKNDAEWWRYHADSFFQIRERACLHFQCVKGFIVWKEERLSYMKRRQLTSSPFNQVEYNSKNSISPQTKMQLHIHIDYIYLSVYCQLAPRPQEAKELDFHICSFLQFPVNAASQGSNPLCSARTHRCFGTGLRKSKKCQKICFPKLRSDQEYILI